jgi:predicted nucleotidyltransferase
MESSHSTSVKRFVEEIVGAIHPLRIILFGSIARGAAAVESDVDLLVVMPDDADIDSIERRLYRDVPRHGTPLDVVVTTPTLLELYADKPGLIYQAILREGREVYRAA